MRFSLFQTLGVGLVAILGAGTSWAAECQVPSAPHPTLQSAVSDLACTEIVLASRAFRESVTLDRDLTLSGTSSSATIIEGQVVVDGATTQVTINDLKVDASASSVTGCFNEALVAQGGAQISAYDAAVINGGIDGCVLFGDSFDTGETSAWSSTHP